jgi:hypothetical protein
LHPQQHLLDHSCSSCTQIFKKGKKKSIIVLDQSNGKVFLK